MKGLIRNLNPKETRPPLIHRWHAEQESLPVSEVKARSREAGR
jgi:hypothetical protein